MGTKKEMAIKRIKKALEIYKEKDTNVDYFNVDDIKILFDELNKSKETIEILEEELTKIDKVLNLEPGIAGPDRSDEIEAIKKCAINFQKAIDIMAEAMADIDYDYMCGNWCENDTGCDGEERDKCIKRYFIQKVADTNVGDIPEQN